MSGVNPAEKTPPYVSSVNHVGSAADCVLSGLDAGVEVRSGGVRIQSIPPSHLPSLTTRYPPPWNCCGPWRLRGGGLNRSSPTRCASHQHCVSSGLDVTSSLVAQRGTPPFSTSRPCPPSSGEPLVLNHVFMVPPESRLLASIPRPCPNPQPPGEPHLFCHPGGVGGGGGWARGRTLDPYS